LFHRTARLRPVQVDLLVMVAGMIPSPGEPPRDWWGNTGYEQAKREQAARDGRATGEDEDVIATFLHDVPPDLAAEALKRGWDQSSTPMESRGRSRRGPT
jgi:hypothetical protein